MKGSSLSFNYHSCIHYNAANFQRMELEKKKAKPTKKKVLGDFIRYHSVAMPTIDPKKKPSVGDQLEDGIETDDDAPPLPSLPAESGEKHSRTFLSFSNDELLKKTFESLKAPKRKPRQNRYCALTKSVSRQLPLHLFDHSFIEKNYLLSLLFIFRIPAQYFDPLLRTPYYNMGIFRILRAAYHRILYLRGDRRKPSVRRYCEYLERKFPNIYNREKMLAKNPHLQSQLGSVAESAEAENSMKVGSKSEKNVPKSATAGGRKLSHPRKMTISQSQSGDSGSSADEKRKPSASAKAKKEARASFLAHPVSVRFRPPTSRIKPLPNPRPLIQNKPNILRSSKAPVALAASIAKKTEGITKIQEGAMASAKVIKLVSPPATPVPAAISLSKPASASPTASSLAKPMLGSKQNEPGTPLKIISSPQALATSTPVQVSNLQSSPIMAQKNSSPIVIKNLNQLSHVPTSSVQLAVSSGSTGAGTQLAFLNVRGVPIRGINNQVMRLLQQQGLHLIPQQASQIGSSGGNAMSQSGSLATGVATNSLPVTVRLPISQQNNVSSSGAGGAVSCSTASALVAANSIRLASGATARPILSGSPLGKQLSATNTVGVRTSPITASVSAATSAAIRGTRSPISPLRTAAGIRQLSPGSMKTVTFTASQLRHALSVGAAVRASPGGNTFGGVRAITIPSSTSKGNSVIGGSGNTMNVLKPVPVVSMSSTTAKSLATTGSPTVTGRNIISGSSIVWQDASGTSGPTLYTIPASSVNSGGIRSQTTASSILAAAGASVRLSGSGRKGPVVSMSPNNAVGNVTGGSNLGQTTLMMTLPKATMSTGGETGGTISSSNARMVASATYNLNVSSGNVVVGTSSGNITTNSKGSAADTTSNATSKNPADGSSQK